MTRREALIEKIKRQGSIGYGRPAPVVSLEDFFTGNDDFGSIGCNVAEHPGPDKFYSLLREIRDRENVQDVLMEIYEIEESDETIWPYSEQVYVITSASVEDVANWLAPLQPDEVGEGWANGKPDAAAVAGPGHRVVAAWWD